MRPKNREREIWDGFRYRKARSAPLVDAAFLVSELEQRPPDHLRGCAAACTTSWASTPSSTDRGSALHLVRMRRRRDGRTTPTEIVTTQVSIHEVQFVKQELNGPLA
ncbi:MAG: hypothetical protein IPH72_32320 [Sandaracinaceae bacterium]|nr:hypothetical protein [Sandaracinaceae bacterium]